VSMSRKKKDRRRRKTRVLVDMGVKWSNVERRGG
jgi:hypothetical protein